MFDWLTWLFDSSPFVPRPQCGGWSDGLIWLTMASDVLIWLAYMAIPMVLYWVGRKRRDFPHRGVIWLFVVFIISCGFTHLIDVFTFHYPVYRLGGAVRAITALASWATVIALVPLTPKLLAMRSPVDLAREVEQRKHAQEQLRVANESLEDRVCQRTAELEAANAALKDEIAERERAEKELRRKTRELEALSREMENFAYVASHDLQEPLRKINGFAQLVQEHLGERLDQDGRDYLDRMVRASDRMNVMVKDLLLLSRAGGEAVMQQPVNLNRVMERVANDLEPAIREAGATLNVGDLPTVKSNPLQMEQVFLNLISNAIKYRDKARPPVIDISADLVDAGYTRIAVKDNGIGFDPAQAERIFQPFQRLHSQREYPGTGMGLPICRKIVERLGGEIAAEGRPGEGSTFYFTLPLMEDES
jgi:signal transduction histidine kinase